MKTSEDYINEIRLKKNVKKILFVCTGNSCRSIMAEGYMKKLSDEQGLGFEMKSAGTLGIKGMAPTAPALKVMQDEGIDTGGYESDVLTEQIIKWADIILVMEPGHKTAARDMVPSEQNKVFYLGEFNPEKGDVIISDPIGHPLAFYRVTFRTIKQSIEELIRCLKK